MAKLSTLFLASVLLRVAEGFSSSGKDLPSLVREKRIIDVLDDDDDTSGSENELEAQTTVGEMHVNINDKPKPLGKHFHIHRDESGISSARVLNQESNAGHHSTTKHNSSKRHKLLRKHDDKYIEKRKSFKPAEDRRPARKAFPAQINWKQDHKIILPGVEFGRVSQEMSRAPPPSEEMQHRTRMRMKRKKRRCLRALKRITESKNDELQNEERRKTTVSSAKTALVGQGMHSKHAQEAPRMTEPTSSSMGNVSIIDTEKSKFVSSSLTPSTKTNMPNSSLASKQSLKSSTHKGDSSTSSLLKRPKRFPLNDENAATNRFSTLEITLKSKIMSLNPELPAHSEVAQSSPSISPSPIGLSPSLAGMPAEDLLINFFEHAASPSTETDTSSSNVNQDDSRDPKSEIPNKLIDKTRVPVAQQKQAEKTRQEKRNQEDDDYELKLLEFQKKTIEDEEQRLKERFGLERQKNKASGEGRLKQLDRKNHEKKKEMHILFEKFTETNKQSLNPKTLPDHNDGGKRSFINAIFSEENATNDLDGVDNDDDDLNRQEKKMAQSKNKRTIKKQKTINAGGDWGDEITEVAFYDENSNQNKNMDGLTNAKTANDSNANEGLKNTNEPLEQKEINEESTGLMESISKKENGKTQSVDLQADGSGKLSIEKEEKYTQNINVKKNDEKLEGSDEIPMENDDLMESKGKNNGGDGKSNIDIQVDIPKEKTVEVPEDKDNMNNIDSMERDGKEEDEEGGVHIQVDADNRKQPIFTEIKDEEPKHSNDQDDSDIIKTIDINNESELPVPKNKNLLENKTRGNNNNKSSTSNSKSNNSSNHKDNNSNSNHNNKNSSEDNSNQEDDNVMLHDKRLMYILTGEGAKPPEGENTGLKVNNDLGANSHGNKRIQSKQNSNDVKINIGKPFSPKKMIINEGLKSKIKEMHNRILNAHNRVSQELEQMEQELSSKFDTLQASMSTAKTLTTDVDNKIHNSVRSVLELATSSAQQAKAKLDLVQKAAVALNNIEVKMGANETRNFARILKSKLPDLTAQKNKTYQKILAINNVIMKMDGARIIALEKANSSYKAEVNIENSMSEVAGNVLDELKSTEKELKDDVEMEIEDEIEADRKIRDAKSRNYKSAVKTAQALEKIEGYLKQLENDENRLRALES